MARRYARDPAEAEDLAQEALLKAWLNRTQLRDRRRWPQWLGQITRNHALRTLERGHPVPVEEVEERAEVDARLEALGERVDVQEALSRLSASDREILRLRYVEDLTQPKVAKRLGIGESAAKVRLSRARRKLSVQLRDHAAEEGQSTSQPRALDKSRAL